MLRFITFLQLLSLKLQIPKILIFNVLCIDKSVIFVSKKRKIWNLYN